MTEQLIEKPSSEQELFIERARLDLEAVLGTPQGRRVLVSILERCGVYRSPYTGETDATNFRLGEHNVGLWLIAQIETTGPMTYPTLLIERAGQTQEKRVALVDEE